LKTETEQLVAENKELKDDLNLAKSKLEQLNEQILVYEKEREKKKSKMKFMSQKNISSILKRRPSVDTGKKKSTSKTYMEFEDLDKSFSVKVRKSNNEKKGLTEALFSQSGSDKNATTPRKMKDKEKKDEDNVVVVSPKKRNTKN